MSRFYLINYNRLILKDTNCLIDFLFDDNPMLRKIAHDIILNDDRLLDNNLDPLILKEIIDVIELEDVWYLASLSKEYNVSKIAYRKIMDEINQFEVLENRRLIKLLNGKMPS